MKQYFLQWRGQRSGPFTIEEIEQKLSDNEIGLWHQVGDKNSATTVGDLIQQINEQRRSAQLQLEQAQQRAQREARERIEHQHAQALQRLQEENEALADELENAKENHQKVAVAPPNPFLPPQQPASPNSFASVHDRLTYLIFALAVISFFLPIIVVTLPILGNRSMSMFDLLTSPPNNSGDDNSSSGSTTPGASQSSNPWSDIAQNKQSAGVIICALSFLLFAGHYILTIVWGFFAFVLKQTYDFLTFIWLCLAVQFPILFLIGGQILVGGMKGSVEKNMEGNPFAAIGDALVANVTIQPGLVTWFLMFFSSLALISLSQNKQNAFRNR